ncbi:MAG: DUF2635 domain-containing protein [Chromatiales bacterium]|nr:DUF2635 domain-containing protein [Gammaproteobacteria bacterium]
MPESHYLKPADGRLVRDPVTSKHLASNGEDKPRNSYWLRRLKDGDVVEAKRPRKSSK